MNVVELNPMQAPLAASELNGDFLKANQCSGSVCSVCVLFVCVCACVWCCWCFLGGDGVLLCQDPIWPSYCILTV